MNKAFCKFYISLYWIWHLYLFLVLFILLFKVKNLVDKSLISFFFFTYFYVICFLSLMYYYAIKNLTPTPQIKYFTFKEYNSLQKKPFFDQCTPLCILVQSLFSFFFLLF